MGSGADGFAPLNLLLVVLVFGLLLLPWSELWRKPVMREAVGKRPRPLKPKTGADCPLWQAEPGATNNEGRGIVPPQPWRDGRSPCGREKASVARGHTGDSVEC
jgi:hypothetical protein